MESNDVKGTPTARGHIVFSDTAAVVRLFKGGADLSTFMHEAGHLFVRDLENLLATGNAPQSVINDFADLTFEQLTATQRDRVLATAQRCPAVRVARHLPLRRVLHAQGGVGFYPGPDAGD